MRVTRWNDTCILVKREPGAVDDEGVMRERVTRREVFCNSYTISTQTWATARLADYTADEEIQIRTADYDSEQDVIYRGKSYSVLHLMNQGENTRLLLKRYKHDVGDEEDPDA